MVAALLLLPLLPPVEGRMLLLPIAPGAAAQLPRVAIAHGALLLGAGPFAGSLIVIGRRADLAGPLLHIGAVAFATDGGGCTVAQA